MSRFPRSAWRLIPLFLLAAACATRAAAGDAEVLVDPTRPLFDSGTAESEGGGPSGPNLLDGLRNYEVSSILIRQDLRLAVVNSQRVRVGDEIGAATVLAIEPGRVLLDLNGETREVKLHRNSIKTPAGESEGEDVPE